MFHCICFLFPVWKWFTGDIYAHGGNLSRWLDKAILHIFWGVSVGTGRDCFWFTFETKLTTALTGEGGVCPKSHLPVQHEGSMKAWFRKALSQVELGYKAGARVPLHPLRELP